MKSNEVMTMIIGTIVIFLIASVTIVPIVSSALATSDTIVNDGYYKMGNVESDYTLSWDSNNPNILVVNGENVYAYNRINSTDSYTIVTSDNMALRTRMYASGNVTFTSYAYGVPYFSLNANNGDSFDLTINEGVISITYTKSGTDTTVNYRASDSIYAVMPDGEFVMKYASKGAYVLEDSSIILLAGLSKSGGGADVGIFAMGTVDDLEFEYFKGEDLDPVISNVTPDKTDVETYVGVIRLDKYTMDLTTSDGSTTLTYNYFLVPSEITADRTNPITGVMNTILSILPVFVFIGIVVGIVSYLRLRT